MIYKIQLENTRKTNIQVRLCPFFNHLENRKTCKKKKEYSVY
jgi:hypothetical protein